MNERMKIGVFDSGVGGKSVANAIHESLPELDIVYAEDKENVPYGTKTPSELFELTFPILNKLSNEGCKVIVIACNTVTTTIIGRLRASLPVPLIGMEPMVKTAANMTKSDVIAVCATPATLASERYATLKKSYAADIEVLEPDCSDWASMIEESKVDKKVLRERIGAVCTKGADIIVLGCTHYHWIEEELQEIANEYGATVLQPEEPVISQLKRVLATLGS